MHGSLAVSRAGTGALAPSYWFLVRHEAGFASFPMTAKDKLAS